MTTRPYRLLVAILALTVCSSSIWAQQRQRSARSAAPPSAQKSTRRTATQQQAPATTQRATTQRTASQNVAAQNAANKPSGAAAQAPAVVSPEVLYTPPKTNDVTELSTFLARLLDYQPRTQEELAEFQKRAPAAMNYAAQRIMQVEKDKSSPAYRFAMNYVLAMRMMEFDKTTAQERQQIMAQLTAALSQPTLDPDVLDLAVAFAENLEFVGETKAAAQAYAVFAGKIAKNEDPLVAELAKSLNASARRLNLVGQPMQVVGKTVDGRNFDWSKYRGKVVVVDFWATWCGPCVAEMPSLKKHYDTYGRAGLEIVGISLDQDAEQLQTFLQKNNLPWVTLHGGKDEVNPTAKYYGISALPTTMVIDRQGKVVALNARGAELEKVLAGLLGQGQRTANAATPRR